MTLHPTKTRLDLLRAVAAGRVISWPDGNRGKPWTSWETIDGGVAVTARAEELRRVGWIERDTEPSYGTGYRWRITDAGRAVLDEASPS